MRWRWMLVGGAAVGAVAWVAACGTTPAPAPDDAARVAALVALPEPERCAVCHEANVRSWRTSGHGRALQPVATADVLPPDGAYVSGAWPSRLTVASRDGALAMGLVDADGEYREYPVTHVLGGVERQMFVASMGPDGRPQMLPAEWGRATQRFRQFWRPQDQHTVPPGDPAFWRTFDRAFVNDCVRCHSPRTRVRYDADAGAYHVDWGKPGDVGLSCSTCHGDCDAHVESAHAHGRRARPEQKPLPTKGAQAELYSCARCHSQSARVGRFPRADEEFYDALAPTLLDDPVYYYVNGRNFGEAGHSLLSWELAECFRRGGLRCTDCHPPHGGGTHAQRMDRARASCAKCHATDALPRPCREHRGADCLQCHMPRFAVANGHAHVTDHRIAVPDPVLTRDLGIPNACQECHREPVDWQIEKLEGWGFHGRPERARALALGRARRDPPDPAVFPVLRALVADAEAPWPYAASAARVLGAKDASPEALASLCAAATGAAHPMVRSGAAFGLAHRGEPEATVALRAGLRDARRVVRVMAAAALVFRRDTESLAVALAQLREVRDEVPDYFDIREVHAWGLLFAGKPDEALAEARRLAKIHDDDPRVRTLLDACQRALEDR